MNELEEMCRAHFNEPAIFHFDLGRVVGYAEDEMDAYIIAQFPLGKGKVWQTCVGGYTFLNRLVGQDYVRSHSGEDWDDIFRLDRVLALNGAPKAAEFECVYHDAVSR